MIKGNCLVLFHVFVMQPMPLDTAKSVKLPIGRHKTNIYDSVTCDNYTYLERTRRDLSTYAGRRYIHAYPNEPHTKDMFLADGDIFVVLSRICYLITEKQTVGQMALSTQYCSLP